MPDILCVGNQVVYSGGLGPCSIGSTCGGAGNSSLSQQGACL